MPGLEKRKRRRARLWIEQGGKCFWCQQRMTMEWPTARGSKIPDHAATVDHLNDRFSPRRRDPAQGEQRWVLACRKCNWERGVQSQQAQSEQELWRRSGRAPLSTLADVWPA